MDCDKAYRRMYRYLDGEITVIRRWRITRHLGKCPPCAKGYDFELVMRQVIATRCRDEVPPELKRKIAEQLQGMCAEQARGGAQSGGTAPATSDATSADGREPPRA
jgi:mycothiol system anti-sigma-R factor